MAATESTEPADGLLDQARELLAAKRYAQAHRFMDEVVGSIPDCAEANYLMGVAASRLNRLEEASDYLTLALHYRPEHAPSLLELGVVQAAQGHPFDACATLTHAVGLEPGSARAHRQLGLVQLKQGQLEAAEVSLRRAIEIAPEDAYARSDLAYLLFRERGQAQAALQLLRQALADNPACADAHLNLGMIEQYRAHWSDALAHYDRALELDAGAHEARLNRGLIRLMSGRFSDGWRDYEARKLIGNVVPGMNLNYPEWHGESLSGTRVLVYGEQGLGDEIMFASCIAQLLEQTSRVVLYCSPKLERLFRFSFPATLVCSGEQTGSPSALADLPWQPDFKLAIGSLALHFRSRDQDFPKVAGYLKADPVLVQQRRKELTAAGKVLSVGISWRGGTAKTRRNERSIALDELVPLLRTPGVRWVNLQYGECADEVSRLRDHHGIDMICPEPNEDYARTAAWVEALDLVISVCTAVVHLGGALGKPVWALVPCVPEWRYMHHGATMPWYPSVELFRQSQAGNWRDSIDEVARCLALRVKGRCC